MEAEGKNKFSCGNILIAATSLLYVLLPFDFIPDFIGTAGRLDDLAALAAAVFLLRRRLLRRAAGCAGARWLAAGLATLLIANYFALFSAPPAWFYNILYRVGAPWENEGLDPRLTGIIGGEISPRTLPPGRAIDLGCGSGMYTIFMARGGFDALGVDFSEVALEKGRRAAAAAGVSARARFEFGDLTSRELPGITGPFDFLLAVGTLDDLPPAGRRAMASLITRLSRPGSVFLACQHVDTSARKRQWLTTILFGGVTALPPDEMDRLFDKDFDITRPAALNSEEDSDFPCFLMTRKRS